MVLTMLPTAMASDAGDLVEVPEEALDIDANGVCSGIKLNWFNANKPESGKYLSVTIPATVKKIEKNAFYNYKNLGSNVYLGTVIGAVDFSKATALEEIGYAAFSSQSNLSGVIDLSNTKVKLIDGSAFRATAITGVVLPSSLESLGSAANGGSAFTECKKLQYVRTAGGDASASFELPSALTYIGGYTFRYSFANPVMLKLPASVETIGSEAFNSGNIEQIIVERAEDYSGFNAKAVNGAGMAVFKDMAAYNAFANSISSSYRSNLTYPVQLIYQGTDITQTKLNKKSIQYELNSTTGFWEQNKSYTLPEFSESAGVPAGFTAAWKLNDKDLTNTTVLDVTGDTATATYDLSLVAPTIEYTKNGVVQSSNQIAVELTKTQEQTVGIKLSHPLLDKQLEEGEDVAVFYYWHDLKDFTDGPRNAEASIFKKWNNGMAEIPITSLEHARTGIDCYRVYFQLGYEKNGKTYWYKRTSDPIIINVSVTQAQEYTVSYDLDGGTAPENVSYDAVTVVKGTDTPTKAAPVKSGYVFTGWSDGTNTYYAGQEFTVTGNMTLIAQWQEVEDWNQQPSESGDGKLDVAVDVVVNVETVTGAQASVSEAEKQDLSNDVRDALSSILSGSTPDGVTAEQAEALRDVLNLGAPSVEAKLTVNAALQGEATEDQKTQLGDKLSGGESAQVWDLSVDLAVTAKNGNTTLSSVEKMPVATLTDPITITLTTGENYSGKTVRVLYIHNDEVKTADAKVEDAAKGVISVQASEFSHYFILSKAAPVYVPTVTPPKKDETKPEEPAYDTCPKTDVCPIADFRDADPTAWYHDGVHYCLDEKLMDGYDDGTFRPDTATTRAQLVVMLWRLSGSPVVTDALPFADVQLGDWYAEAIRWAASAGIAQGVSADAFAPNDTLTREQLVSLLWRYAKCKGCDVSVGEKTNILSFADAASVSDYAVPAMQWACGAGIVSGETTADGTYLTPGSNATRAQVATMLMRFCAQLEVNAQ